MDRGVGEEIGSSGSERPRPAAGAGSARARIIDAAFAAFAADGYARTTMLAIATRAKVSKRELYALVGNKQQMLAACIGERAGRMLPPADLPEPTDLRLLAQALATFGAQVLREVSQPAVLGVYRLAIAEAERAPEIAAMLDGIGRAAVRQQVAAIFGAAAAHGVVAGEPARLASRFLALLWGDLLVNLLLALAEPPTEEEAADRARQASETLLREEVR